MTCPFTTTTICTARQSAHESGFADTSFFLAVINPRDQHHLKAVELNTNLGAPLITTCWVLLEFANGIAASRSRNQFEQILLGLRSQPDVEIIPADPEAFEHGCELYGARRDKEWSLTDCITFHVMKKRKLEAALTNDHHFEQAGFRALMRI